MKGYVKLSRDNGNYLIDQCIKVLETYKPDAESAQVSYWYSSRKALLNHFYQLDKMLNLPDPIYISLLAYGEMLRLSECDSKANPTFILDY